MLIKLILQFCRKLYSMELLCISNNSLPQIFNKVNRDKIPFSLVIYLCQSILFLWGIHFLCKTNLAWLSLRHFVRLLTEGNKKGALQGKVFLTLKRKFTQPCCQAPKAYIGMFVTIAQKISKTKIQENLTRLANKKLFLTNLTKETYEKEKNNGCNINYNLNRYCFFCSM